jgi:hypothetical protein
VVWCFLSLEIKPFSLLAYYFLSRAASSARKKKNYNGSQTISLWGCMYFLLILLNSIPKVTGELIVIFRSAVYHQIILMQKKLPTRLFSSSPLYWLGISWFSKHPPNYCRNMSAHYNFHPQNLKFTHHSLVCKSHSQKPHEAWPYQLQWSPSEHSSTWHCIPFYTICWMY